MVLVPLRGIGRFASGYIVTNTTKYNQLKHYVFGSGALTSLVMNLICYLLFLTFPKQHLPVAMFVLNGFVLSIAQAHKQIYYNGQNGLDLCMTLMFSYCKNKQSLQL